MADHVAGARRVLDDVLEDFTVLSRVQLTRGHETLRGLRVAENGGQRLVQLVGHRGRQFAHDGHARNVRQFLAMPERVQFRLLAGGDVKRSAHHPGRLPAWSRSTRPRAAIQRTVPSGNIPRYSPT